MNRLVPPNIADQQANIARLTREIETLRHELAYERHVYRRKLVRHIFFLLRMETEVDMEIAFPQTQTESTETCSICLEPLCNADIRELQCQHGFHRKCIDRWIQTSLTCPMCRDPIPIGESSSTLMLQLFRMLSEELGV